MIIAEGCTNVYPEWELWTTIGVIVWLSVFLGMSIQDYINTKGGN